MIFLQSKAFGFKEICDRFFMSKWKAQPSKVSYLDKGLFYWFISWKNIKMEKNETWHMEIEISHVLKIPFVSLGLPYNI